MGTRGLMGFRLNGVDKLCYNHSDSYPDGLGDDVNAELQIILLDFTFTGIVEMVEKIRMVTEDEPVTEDDITRLKEYHASWASSGAATEWYSLLRNLQGKLRDTLTSGIMLEYGGFINESLFCEWAYIVNLDTRKLEVYKGFQTKKLKNAGRYMAASRKPRGWKPEYAGQEFYYPCALIAEFSFDALPVSLNKEVEKLLPAEVE
jgi:hypothetical protein